MPQLVRQLLPAGLAALAMSGSGCDVSGSIVAATGASGSDQLPPAERQAPVCKTLDFDVDSDGAPIAPGTVLNDVYARDGVSIRVWRDRSRSKEGLPVAFDSKNPTGGDDDLSYENLGNLLISQECFEDHEIKAGRVNVPDDDAKGAMFEFQFDSPVCVSMLTLLDIDDCEEDVSIRLFDRDDNEILEVLEPPMGNNERQDVMLPPTDSCNVMRVKVVLSGSGAIDNLEYCQSPVTPGENDWTDQVNIDGDNQTATGVDTDRRDNVFVSGYTEDALQSDALLAKYSADGVQRWIKVIDGGGNDLASDVVVDPYDDVIVVGYTQTPEGDLDGWVRKFDKHGNDEWERTFDRRGGEDFAESVATDSAGNVIVTGGSGGDIWIQKYRRDGSDDFTIIEPGPFKDIGRGVATDEHGDFFVVGEVGNGTDADGWIRKYSRDGVEVFTDRFIGPVGDDVARGVATDSAGNAVVIGDTLASGFDIWVRKYEPDGGIEWTRDFDGGVLDLGFDVDVDRFDDIVTIGYTASPTSNTLDIWLRKYDPDGQPLRTLFVDNGSTDLGFGIAADRHAKVLAVGSANNGLDDDLFITKLSL